MTRIYADSSVWDKRFELEGDLDWGGLWTDPVIGLLRDAGARRLLDLGCGTGSDVARLATAGFAVTGLDFSESAIETAQAKGIPEAEFVQADMANGLPFSSDSFDAVLSNVALHMFDDSTTARIVADVRRILRPDSFFVFHVNSREDRALRSTRKKVTQELGSNLIEEEDGQTVHFFSEEELKVLFADWKTLDLEHLEIGHRETGEPFKRVWRGIAKG